MTIPDQIKELEQLQNQAAALKSKIEEEREAKLASMHEDVGLESTEALIDALQGLAKAPPKKKKRIKAPAIKRKRPRLTPAQKEKIANAIKDGLKGTEASRKFGVSLATVQNIKKSFGLVKSRGKKSAE